MRYDPRTGRPITPGRLDIPAGFPVAVPEVARAFQVYHERVAVLNTAQNKFYELKRQRGAAEEADREAAADAIEQGKVIPRPINVQKYERELAEAQRMVEGATLAFDRAEGALLATVDAHKTEWSEQQHAMYRDAITGVRLALDKLFSAAIDLNRAAVMERFVKQFPTFSLNGRTVDGPGGFDVKFTGRDSKSLAEVLGAIDELVGRLENPPAPPELPRLPLNVKKGQTWLPVTRV